LAGPLRAALAGRAVTPSVFDMMLVLEQEESLARLTQATVDTAATKTTISRLTAL
ncbi:hypothetical protein N9P29_01745, partial [bacterium]|nr:hypothetical protein [bacterium]